MNFGIACMTCEVRQLSALFLVLAFDQLATGQVPRRPDESHAGVVSTDAINWSTYFGGGLQDNVRACVRDVDGSLLVVGQTLSPTLPVTPGAYDSSLGSSGDGDAFIARIGSDGALLACTYLGGSLSDLALDVAVGPDGTVVCAGRTFSSDFPATAGFGPPSHGVFGDLFICCFTHDLSMLLHSAVLGGAGIEGFTDQVHLALAADGGMILAGPTTSVDMPITRGAYDETFAGLQDCWIGRFSSDLTQLEWGTYLGGSGGAKVSALAVDADGSVLLTGRALASDFPQTIAPWPLALKTTNQLFIARLSADGANLLHSGFIMSNNEEITALRIDSAGQVFLGGGTLSDEFPITPGVYDTTPNSLYPDGFILFLAPDLNTLIRSTYTGLATDIVQALDIDASGCPTFVTLTTGGGFVGTPGALLPSQFPPQCNTYIVGRLDPTFEHLLYGTYLGGATDESAAVDIVVGPQGELLLAGTTDSIDYPVTPGAFQPDYAGGANDAVVTNLSMLPTGVQSVGASTPGCLGPLAAGAASWASIALGHVGLTCTAAPPSSMGLLAVSLATLPSPLMASGVAIWIDPASLLVLVPAKSGETGFARVDLRVPDDQRALGAQAAVQFLWKDPCGPAGWSASNALRITLVP